MADWKCSGCGYLLCGSLATCWKCGTVKSDAAGAGPPPDVAQDWICQFCGFENIFKRTDWYTTYLKAGGLQKCRKCQRPRPQAAPDPPPAAPPAPAPPDGKRKAVEGDGKPAKKKKKDKTAKESKKDKLEKPVDEAVPPVAENSAPAEEAKPTSAAQEATAAAVAVEKPAPAAPAAAKAEVGKPGANQVATLEESSSEDEEQERARDEQKRREMRERRKQAGFAAEKPARIASAEITIDDD